VKETLLMKRNLNSTPPSSPQGSPSISPDNAFNTNRESKIRRLDDDEFGEEFQECTEALNSNNDERLLTLIKENPQLLKNQDQTLLYTLIIKDKIDFICAKLELNIEKVINDLDCNGCTLLYIAIRNSNIVWNSTLNNHNEVDECIDVFELVKKLLSLGAKVDLPNYEGQTPLQAAAEKGHFDVVELLCERGAETEWKDRSGKSVLHYAVEAIQYLPYACEAEEIIQHSHPPTYIEKGRIIEYLCKEEKNNPNIKDEQGRTPLHLITHWYYTSQEKQEGADKFFIDVAQTLLRCGADINIKDIKDQSIADLDVKQLISVLSHPIKELTFEENAVKSFAPSLQHAQKWENIPRFAVVTGRNGSGKSQLLKYIHHSLGSHILCIDKLSQSSTPPRLFTEHHYTMIYPELKSENARRKLIAQVKNTNLEFVSEEAKLIAQKIQQERLNIADVSDEDILQYRAQIAVLDPHTYIIPYFDISSLTKIFAAYNDKKEALINEYLQNPKEFLFPAWCIGRKIQENENQLDIFNQENKSTLELLAKSVIEKEIGPPPWLDLQALLKENIQENFELDYKSDTLLFKKKVNDTKVTIHGLSKLSDGERLIIEMFYWQYYIQGLSSNDTQKALIEKPKVILLDEPDRHFDPELSKIFMKCLTKLSDKHNIQVIMTTHRTDTLAYAPEGSLFTIKRDKINNSANIKPTNRLHALFKLTSNLREITNFHVKVYTESLDDATFYEKIYHQLLRISEAKRKIRTATPDGLVHKPREILSRRFQLSFYSVAMDKLGGGGGCHVIPPAVQRETLALDNIDRAETENFVKRKIEYPFGLIDADYDVEKLNPTRIKSSFNDIKPRLLYTKRHSLENYIYDPAILFSLLNETDIEEMNSMLQHGEEDIKQNNNMLKKLAIDCRQSLKVGPNNAVQKAFDAYFRYFLDKFISVQEKSVESDYLQNYRYLNPDRKPDQKTKNKGGKGKSKEKKDFSEFLSVYRNTFNIPPAIKDEEIIKSVEGNVTQTLQKFNKRKDGYADNRINTRKYLKEDLTVFFKRQVEESEIVETLLNAGARDIEVFSPDGTKKYTIRYPGFFIFARGHNIEDFFQKTFISKGDQNIRAHFKKWLIDKVIAIDGLFLPIDLVDIIVELDRKVTNHANTVMKPQKPPLSVSAPFIN
jgi:ankyrin repeat protein